MANNKKKKGVMPSWAARIRDAAIKADVATRPKTRPSGTSNSTKQKKRRKKS